jgi:hypothetical protein
MFRGFHSFEQVPNTRGCEYAVQVSSATGCRSFLISNIRPGEVAAYFTYAGGICRTLISAGAALCIEIKLGQDRKSAGDHNPRKQEFNRIPKK